MKFLKVTTSSKLEYNEAMNDDPNDPKSASPAFDTNQMIQTAKLCPVCKDQPLWSADGATEKIAACLQCRGFATTVESLQKASGKSLFGPSMFIFRPNDGKPESRFRIKCLNCAGQMSEYVLKDVVIDRCQICNAVWLDDQEFDKVINATPDLRRRYDEVMRKREQMRMEALATSHSHRLSIGQTEADRDDGDGAGLWDIIDFFIFE